MASAVAAPAVGSVHSLKSLSLSSGSAGSYGPSSAFLGTSLRRSSGSLACVNSKPLVVSASAEEEVKKKQDRWGGLAYDVSDDQQDITRGKGMVDALYQGAVGLGTQTAVMSSYEYMSAGQRIFKLDNMKDGYYIAPAFMDKIVVHIAKNFMSLPNIKIPLILGIWGGKGQGKSFQCELVFSKLGINPIMMSAGELESGNAGEPAKLIRQRYREAADIIKKKGQMCVLFINDLDAGAGRMGGTTQYTVNNQMVNATLMNIADNPTNVQLPGIYNKEDLPRVPIVVTGNDFSTLYAPLIRDGRMEKFYWAPTRDDRVGVCQGIFRTDDVPSSDITKLVDTFPGQSIDFFGALRARVYDDEVRKWVIDTGVEQIGKKLVNSKEGPPTFAKPKMTVEKLLEYGFLLVQEQDNVNRVQLADKYLGKAALGDANDDAISQGTFYGPGAGSGAQSAEVSASDQSPSLVGRTAGRGTPAADEIAAEISSSSSDHVFTDERIAEAVKIAELRLTGVKEKTEAAEEVGEQQQEQENMAELPKDAVAKPLDEPEAKPSELRLPGEKEKTEADEEVGEQQLQEIMAELPNASVAKPLDEPEAKPSELRLPGEKEKTAADEEVGEQQQQEIMAELPNTSVAKPLDEAEVKPSELSLTGEKEKTKTAEEVGEQQQQVNMAAELPKDSVAKPLDEPEAKKPSDPVRGLFSLIWAILKAFFSVLRSLLRL